MPMMIVLALFLNIAIIPFVSFYTLAIATLLLTLPYLSFILTAALILTFKNKKDFLKYVQILPALQLSYGFGSLVGIFMRKPEAKKFFYPHQ